MYRLIAFVSVVLIVVCVASRASVVAADNAQVRALPVGEQGVVAAIVDGDTLVLESGNVVNGILISRTPQSVTIKDIEAITRTFKTSDIELMKKENTSLMPADIQKLVTAKELVDIVEYMSTLKKKPGKK